MTVVNLKHTPMEFMYMAHVNFRPVDNGRLVYSAPCTPEHVRVRKSIPSHVQPGPGYREFLEELAVHPERHNVLAPDLTFDPEIVFTIDYLADNDGWAHTMQVHPDGSADYVRHTRPRWTRACAGSAARRIRTPWALCCPLPPSRKATGPKKPKATSKSCPQGNALL